MVEKKSVSRSISRRGFIKLLSTAFGVGVATPLLSSCSNEDADGYQVNIVLEQSEIHYLPATITIPAGATVTWLNKSYYSQSATCDPNQAGGGAVAHLPDGAQPWDSGLLYPGQRFSMKFETPGTYIYFSVPKLSTNTIGSVIVES